MVQVDAAKSDLVQNQHRPIPIIPDLCQTPLPHSGIPLTYARTHPTQTNTPLTQTNAQLTHTYYPSTDTYFISNREVVFVDLHKNMNAFFRHLSWYQCEEGVVGMRVGLASEFLARVGRWVARVGRILVQVSEFLVRVGKILVQVGFGVGDLSRNCGIEGSWVVQVSATKTDLSQNHHRPIPIIP